MYVERELTVSSKVTSKLQVTIPKVIADRYGIRPGDEIAWEAVGGALRVRTRQAPGPRLAPEERVRLWQASCVRQRAREASGPPVEPTTERGWTRDELYEDRVDRPR